MAETMMVRCGSCGTLNRIPAQKAGLAARCGECRAELAPGVPVDLTDETFDTRVAGAGRPVLVEFWSPSCGHCIRMAPVLDELARELVGSLVVARLDVTKNPDVTSRYNVSATPAFVLVRAGKEMARFLGAMPKDELKSRVRPFI